MKQSATLVWATPNGEQLVAKMARVSNPENQDNPEYQKLVKYLIKNNHWSPFETINVCMEINTTRDIARQILRHRSFSFQEFSQRYAEVPTHGFDLSEARLQDTKNRQNSLVTDDDKLKDWWQLVQNHHIDESLAFYELALEKGIAKEVARKLLPEGLTMSKMYMNGTLRSWIHYVQIRTDSATQKEHRDVAVDCCGILKSLYPNVMEAVYESSSIRPNT